MQRIIIAATLVLLAPAVGALAVSGTPGTASSASRSTPVTPRHGAVNTCPEGSTFDTDADGWLPADDACMITYAGGHIAVQDLTSGWTWIVADESYAGDWTNCGPVSFAVLSSTDSSLSYPAQLEMAGPAGSALYTFDVGAPVPGVWTTLFAPLTESDWELSGVWDDIIADVTVFQIRLDLTGGVEEELTLVDDIAFGVGACAEDLAPNGIVDVADLLFLLAAWGTPGADVTGDGATDVQDLLAVLGAWGPCTG